MFKSSHYRDALLGRGVEYLDPQDRSLVPTPQPRYRFTIIGGGMMGMEHIRVTLLEGRATIQGLYDPNPQSLAAAQKLFQQLRPNEALQKYNSLPEAVHDPAAEALIISTPNHTHLEVLQVALESRKPILLEKPMATTLQDAQRIVELAHNYPNLIQVGLQYRYKAIYQETIGEALERQSIGAIKTITIIEHRLPFLDKVGQWNKFSEYSGGTLVEKCCHYFDLFNLLAAAKPQVVSAVGGQAVNFRDFEYSGRSSDVIDNAFVNVEYANGTRANLNLCMFSPLFHEEIILCGDEGRIRAFEREDYLPGTKFKSGFEMYCANARPSRISVPEYPVIIQESGHSGSTFFEHVNFIENIEGHSTAAATLQEGFWSIVVGVAAEEALRSGKPVAIDQFLRANNIRQP